MNRPGGRLVHPEAPPHVSLGLLPWTRFTPPPPSLGPCHLPAHKSRAWVHHVTDRWDTPPPRRLEDAAVPPTLPTEQAFSLQPFLSKSPQLPVTPNPQIQVSSASPAHCAPHLVTETQQSSPRPSLHLHLRVLCIPAGPMWPSRLGALLPCDHLSQGCPQPAVSLA